MNRRDLFRMAALAALAPESHAAESKPIIVQFRKPGPYEALRRFIPPEADDFACEREAALIERLLQSPADLPLAADFEGRSPVPDEWKVVTEHIQEARFTSSGRPFQAGMREWLGTDRSVRFYVLADHRVRVEASSPGEYRVTHWHMEWRDGKLTRFRPLDEVRVKRDAPMFVECTGEVLHEPQLLHGSPYWRSRLDSASGIDIYGSNGISVADIDNDGWDEIYVSQPGGLPNRLFKRSTDGRFTEIAAQAGLDLLDETSCSLFADFRNAGVQDAVILLPSGPLYFANNGQGKFHLVKDAFRFGRDIQGTFTGMSAADYDRDGRLDLYFCTYVYFQSEDRYRYPVPYHDAQNGPPNFLFRNRLNADGSGGFEDVTAASGIDQNNNRYSFTASWCDYDGSGWPSLYVANDFGRNNLYRNVEGKFQDVAAKAGVEDLGPGMCASWFDSNGDGRPDLYVANMWTAAGQRIVHDPGFPSRKETDAWRRHTKGNSLYRNRGDGTFEELPDAAGAAVGRWAWGAEGVDFDNDGAPEIFVCTGMLTNSRKEDLSSFFWRRTVARSPLKAEPAPEYENGWNSINQYIREEYSWNGNEPNLFYVRSGDRYYDCSGISGLGFAADTRTFAVTDLDGDGKLDVVLKSRLAPQVRAFRNNCANGRHSIAFLLHGTKSNRDAIGAVVEVDGRKRALQAGSGYLSQHTKRLYFGLGDQTTVKRSTVHWPSGESQVFENLQAGFVYEVTEGAASPTKKPFLASAPVRPSFAKGDDSVRLEPTWLLVPVPLPEQRKGPGFLLITDGSHAAPTGVPVEILDTGKSDAIAAYSIFRRYLFDWRAPLQVPLMILFDARGWAHRIYPHVPSVDTLRADLAAMQNPDRQSLALPFPGWYHSKPSRSFYKLGAAFAGAGYPEQALPYLQQSPDNFRTSLALGQVYLELNRPAEARSHLEKAITLNASSPEAWNNLGGVAIQEGQNKEALKCFERMLELAPNSPYGLTNAAMALARLDRKKEAEDLYRRALSLDSKDSETADRLGLLVAQQGRLAEGIELFKQALTADPANASALNNLSVAYMQSGKTSDAIAALQYGIRVAPDRAILYLNLARIYAATGDRERARQVLTNLLERVPGDSTATKALQQLGEP